MARRSEHSQEQIKEMVLGAAEAIVVRHGIQELTVRKIAMDIGYTVGSIYMVFANMQDLIMHIRLRTLDQLIQQLQLNPEESSEQQLASVAEAYFKFAQHNFNRWHFMFDAAQLNTELPPSYKQKLELLYAPIHSVLAQLRPDLAETEAQLAARGVWWSIHGVTHSYLGGNRNSLENDEATTVLRVLISHFIRGWQIK